MTDGVFVTFGADASQLEAEAKKSQTGIEGIAQALAPLQAVAVHLTQTMTKLAEAANMTTVSLSKMGQASVSTATAHEAIGTSAEKGGQAIQRASKDIEKFNINTSGARRELIVLAHEMAMGNYTRFGGSMMVLAERAGGVTMGMMGAAGAVAVMGLVAATSAIHAEQLTQTLNRAEASLEASGRAALFSRDQLNGTIESLSRMSGIGKDAAESVVGAFARIKDVTPQIMADLTRGMEGWVFLTGEEAPAAAEKLAKGLESPSKFMVQLDQSIGGVSSATLSMVAQLERSGDVFAAKEVAARAFGEAGARVAEKMTQVQLALRDAGNALNDLGDAFSHGSSSGDTLAKTIQVLTEAITLLKTPAAVLGGALRDLVDAMSYLWHATLSVGSALRPVGTAIVEVARAASAAASGDFAQAGRILNDMPHQLAQSWQIGADEVRQHIQEMGAAIHDVAQFRLDSDKPKEGEKSGHKDKHSETGDATIKRGLALAEQYRSADMQRQDIQGQINQLKAAELALVADIAQRKASGNINDSTAAAELRAQEASLVHIKDAITEAERQKKEAGKGQGQETKLQGLEAQLDRRRDMERHAAEDWKVIERDFWDAALKDATKGTTEYDQILRRRTVAQKAVDEEAHRSAIAGLERQREAAEKGSDQRIAIAREEAQQIASFEGVKSKAAQEALLKVEAMEREKADQERQINAEIEAENMRHSSAMAAMERDRLSFEVQMGQTSSEDQITRLRQIRDQEYADELQALNRQKQLMAQRPVELQKVLNQMKAAEDKYHRDVAKLDQQQVMEMRASIQAWVQPMTGAMHTMVSGVLQGTMTMRQLFANALQGIAISYAEKGLEIAGKWAIDQAAMALSAEGSAAQQTAAATEETTNAIAQADMAALGSINADAARAGAAAYASIAAIPIVGPAMAPAASATAWADTMAFSGEIAVAERGLGSVPYDNFPALLHKRESVLPAEMAVPLRAMLKNGPQLSLPPNLARGPTITLPKQADGSYGDAPRSAHGATHYHIQAVDAASFANMVRRGSHDVFKTMQGEISNGGKLVRSTK